MIAETPQNVLIGLFAVTVLGAVVGYAISSIRASKRSRSVAEALQAEWATKLSGVEQQLDSVTLENDALIESITEANERADLATKNQESTDLHSQLLSQRIQSLESQNSSYEEQQMRMQTDFATYKSNKSRELELARIKPASWTQAEQLPLLNKRIQREDSLVNRSESSADRFHASGAKSTVLRNTARSSSTAGLDLPLSQELDIPALAESELPDSVEELEFELADSDVSGDTPRG